MLIIHNRKLNLQKFYNAEGLETEEETPFRSQSEGYNRYGDPINPQEINKGGLGELETLLTTPAEELGKREKFNPNDSQSPKQQLEDFLSQESNGKFRRVYEPLDGQNEFNIPEGTEFTIGGNTKNGYFIQAHFKSEDSTGGMHIIENIRKISNLTETQILDIIANSKNSTPKTSALQESVLEILNTTPQRYSGENDKC